MLRLWGLYVLLLVFAAPAMAQVTPENPEQQPQPTAAPATPAPPPSMPQWDLSAGYTLQIFKQPIGSHLSLQGWYGSAEYNFFSWLGVEAQASGDYRHQPFPGADVSIYGAMAGPRIYPLRHHKLEPWVHFLYGGAVGQFFFPANGGFHSITYTYDSKSWEGGGGFDLNRWPHWGIRLIEIDYERTKFGGSKNQPNYRLAIGFTYRFGKK